MNYGRMGAIVAVLNFATLGCGSNDSSSDDGARDAQTASTEPVESSHGPAKPEGEGNEPGLNPTGVTGSEDTATAVPTESKPGAALYVSPSGGRCLIDQSRIITLPKDNAAIGHTSALSRDEELSMIETVNDGAGGSVQCSLSETSVEVVVEYQGHGFTLQSLLDGGQSADGYVLFEGPSTGGEIYSAADCAVNVLYSLDEGHSALIAYECPEFVSESEPTHQCTAEGNVWATHCRQ